MNLLLLDDDSFEAEVFPAILDASVVAAEPPGFVASAGVERARDTSERLGWPITRLGAWGLTLLLAACMLVPALLDADAGGDVPALVVCAALAVAVTRALFGLLSGGAWGRALGGAPALIAAAAAGGITTAAASALIGVGLPAIVDVSTAVAAASVLFLASVLRVVEVRYELGMRRVYFVGSESSQRLLERELRHRPDVVLVGRATASTEVGTMNVEALRASLLATRASVLVVDRWAAQVPELARTPSLSGPGGVQVWDMVSYYERKLGKVPLAELTPDWFVFGDATVGRRRWLRDRFWRAAEVGIAAALLAVVSVPLVMIGIIIRLTSPGPALYRQRRVGKDDRPFTLLKLRTMLPSSDASPAWAGSEARRVTPLGRHLRRFRVDELPQLWNVLRGDLSLIGPRPEQVAIAGRLADELPNYEFRHRIRPGITGWAQVHLGYAGSPEGSAAKLQRDLFYVKHRSLRLDLLIAWLTLKMVLEGAE